MDEKLMLFQAGDMMGIHTPGLESAALSGKEHSWHQHIAFYMYIMFYVVRRGYNLIDVDLSLTFTHPGSPLNQSWQKKSIRHKVPYHFRIS